MVKKTEAVDSTTSTTRRGTRRARPIRASLGLVRRGEHEGAARLCADDHRCWLGLGFVASFASPCVTASRRLCA